jgi:hypothetical protein
MVMKSRKLVILARGSLLALCTFAQSVSAEEIIPAASLVSSSTVREARSEGIDLQRLNAAPGVHIVDLKDSPFQGEAARKARQEISDQARLGSYETTESVRDLRATTTSRKGRSRRSISALDRTYSTVDEAQPHLQYEPASIRGTRLEHARLIEVATGGGIKDGRWSGVTRTWEVPGLGMVQLDESEFKETGGSITLVREWLNTEVGGKPATLKTMRSPQGKILVSLAWLSDTTDYRLDLQPSDGAVSKANEEALMAIANRLNR